MRWQRVRFFVHLEPEKMPCRCDLHSFLRMLQQRGLSATGRGTSGHLRFGNPHVQLQLPEQYQVLHQRRPNDVHSVDRLLQRYRLHRHVPDLREQCLRAGDQPGRS